MSFLVLQVLAGEEGVFLKFVAKGDSAPTDSPGDLYVTVSIITQRTIPWLHGSGIYLGYKFLHPSSRC